MFCNAWSVALNVFESPDELFFIGFDVLVQVDHGRDVLPLLDEVGQGNGNALLLQHPGQSSKVDRITHLSGDILQVADALVVADVR